LNIARIPQDPQRPGFCDFPRDYSDEYFAQLTGTEKHIDGSFHDIRPRVEALDCRVYALCAGDVWLDSEVERVRKYYRDQGLDAVQVQQITGRVVLDMLAARIAQ
jgi:phage terminase large subunit GpA-like protein